jgi:hypothetical protein
MSLEAHRYHISAASVGDRAWGAFESTLSGSVIGVTSGGVFIRAGADQIVFISRLEYRSPLTITLRGGKPMFQHLELGMLAKFKSNRLVFPKPGLVITAAPTARWFPPLPTIDLADISGGLSKRLRDLGSRVLKKKSDVGLSILLPALLQQPHDGMVMSLEGEKALAAHSKLRKGGFSSFGETLISLLGLGRGLTPSGDDLLVGFLLTLNRWQDILTVSFDVDGLNRQIIAEAFQTTTHLSANLIACAAGGAADERLLDGLDYIVTGHGNPELIADRLADMGSSSGADSLVGILFAFEACGRIPEGP